jgi:hypothetical protein
VENGKGKMEIGQKGIHPQATMQEYENKGVAGGATGEVVENKGAVLHTKGTQNRARRKIFGLKDVTPAVFVRVASKGLTAYVKWKSAEALGNKGAIPERLKVER